MAKQKKHGAKGKANKGATSSKPVAPPFRRVIIKGVLTLESELHIGSGLSGSGSGSDSNTDTENREGSIHLVERDASPQQKPYLPGSGLRGALAAQLDQKVDELLFRRLFGLARQPTRDETDADPQQDKGGIGLLRVFDASLLGDEVGEIGVKRSRTQIDSVTGAAKQHNLSTHELVPAGSQFQVRLMLEHSGVADDGITQSELQGVLGLLDGLNRQALGSGKSIGQGQVSWGCQSVDVIAESDYRSWLLSNLQRSANAPSKVYTKALASYLKPFDQAINDQLASDRWQRQVFRLEPDGPILINDPDRVNANEKISEVNNPKHQFMYSEHDGKQQAVIPGSTLKGWFRAQSRRILLTLTQGEKPKIVNELLGKLFGSTDTGASLLRFEDAFVEFESQHEHIQMFNAVDRFTGGVKDTALFSAKALWTQSPFTGAVSFKEESLDGWMRLLLLYVWQDAKEGDLVLGWGKAKGYGRLQLIAEDEVTLSWLEKPDTTQFEIWQAALDEALGIKKVKE